MNRITLTGINKDISCIALGTDYYGKKIPESDARSLMDYFISAGGTIIDTAHVYSDYLPGEKHMSEKVIGRWMRDNGMRDKIVLSTKGGFPELHDYHISRISYGNIRQDIEESLECLGTDSADIYWLHRDNREVPVSEICDWMNEFAGKGYFTSYGVSNWQTDRIEALAEYADKTGKLAPVASQIKWSLAGTKPGSVSDDTLAEMDDVSYESYKKNSLPVFCYSSQAKGFFSKLGLDGEGNVILPEGKAGERYGTEENLEIYRKLLKISEKTGEKVSVLALLWLLKNKDFTTVPIVGAGKLDQLRESLRAGELNPDDYPELSQIVRR